MAGSWGRATGATPPTYAEILRDTYGASEVYPLTNIASGTDILAFVSAAHDGTLASWTLQNGAGPATGGLAPYLDGSTANSNLGSLALIWNGAIGGLFVFVRASAAEDWSDGIDKTLAIYRVDGSNFIELSKHGTLGLQANIVIGGVSRLQRSAQTTTDWIMWGVTWKDSANGDEGKVYLNGAQIGTTKTGFGVWAGTPSIMRIGLASENSSVWKGWLAYNTFRFGSIWSDTDMANIYADRLIGGPDINP